MSNNKKCENARGFTLIEMAIAIIIIGLLFVPLLKLYENHLERERAELSVSNVSRVVGFVQDYKKLQGHYPCPARMNVPMSSSDYGRAVDCQDPASPYHPSNLSSGNCTNDGICMEEAVASRLGDLTDKHVIVGTVPYRDLQLLEAQSVDGYDSRMVYAVTFSMTDQATFDDSLGAISVIDNDGDPRVVPDGSVDYIVVSPGKSQRGAYSREGVLSSDCSGTAADIENCNVGFETGTPLSNKAVYVSSLRSEAVGSSFFDDTVEYFSVNSSSPWKRVENSPEDIETLALDEVGIGTAEPSDTLTISTIDDATPPPALRVSGAAGNDGKLFTDLVCDKAGNCFGPELIAGKVSDGEGMKCPLGEYMVGIEDGAPVCENEIQVTCPSSAPVMTGVDADGKPICTDVPGASCAAENIALCPGHPTSSTVSLPEKGDGYKTPSYLAAGDCREQKYQCDAGTWRTYQSGKGRCTDTVTPETNPLCTSKKGYTSGPETNYTIKSATACTSATNTLQKDCTCIPYDVPSASCGSCPSGYAATGPIPTYDRKRFCRDNPSNVWWLNKHNSYYNAVDADGNKSTKAAECPSKSSYCSCVVPANTTKYVNLSCPDSTNMRPHPDDGYKKELQFDASTCKFVETGNIIGSCVCKTSDVEVATTTTCPACDEVPKAGKDYFARHPVTCKKTGARLPHSVDAVCEEKNYYWDDVGTTTGDVSLITRKKGNACNCHTDIPGQKLCKIGTESTVYSCECKPL